MSRVWGLAFIVAVSLGGCGRGASGSGKVVLTFPASSVGAERQVLERQIHRYERAHPNIAVDLVEVPDSADQRHQLYVQWLNAGMGRPDVLQLDVTWTPELAAAGWIRPLDATKLDTRDFFPNVLQAGRYGGRLFAVPWFVDVGMLYWRTDLLPRAPRTFGEMRADAEQARREGKVPYGLVWQGARYEGLVTVFLEHLGGFGGRLLTRGRVTVDTRAGVDALAFMRRSVHAWDIVPEVALGWQEEQTRLVFQRGDAAMMRNWPYAYRLMSDPADSRVAGRFAVAPMPAAPGGTPTSTLGGQQLAVNARSRHPAEARALIAFLTAPAQMRERLRVTGQLPARRSLYDEAGGDGEPSPGASARTGALHVPRAEARAVIERAVARPATPIYTELSQTLQVHLHRALTGQEGTARALHAAARRMQADLDSLARSRKRGRRERAGASWPFWLVLAGLLAASIVAVFRLVRNRAGDAAEARAGWALAAPATAVIFVVALFPLGWTFWESLHVHDLRMPWRGRPFVGLANYASLAGDGRFWGALAHTAIFAGLGVTLELMLGLAVALLLDRWRRARGLASAAVLLPWALPTVVAGLVWRFLFEGNGAIANVVLTAGGLRGHPVAWFAHAVTAWVPVVLADVWKTTPFVALLLLAGLSSIDDDLYEAAVIDGAGPWQRLWHVTLPLLRPALLVAVLFRAMDAFRVFGLIYVLTGGGPGTATEPLSLDTYDVLLGQLRFGYGSTLAVATFVATMVVAATFVFLLGRDQREVVR